MKPFFCVYCCGHDYYYFFIKRKCIFNEFIPSSHLQISKSKPRHVQLSLLVKQAFAFSLCSSCGKMFPVTCLPNNSGGLNLFRELHLVLYLTNGSEGKGEVKKNIQLAPLPSFFFFFSVWSHSLFFLAHTKSSEVEPGRWWGYSLGKMCFNVISFKGAHGAERKDGLWYFCLLNLMVGLWYLYLLNVRNLIHHCWQSEHVLCGGHSCLFLQRGLTFILIWETKKRWRKKEIYHSVPLLRGNGNRDKCYCIWFCHVKKHFPCLACEVGWYCGGTLSGMGAAQPVNPVQEKYIERGLSALPHWNPGIWLK